jgi:hypothetical protein
MSGYLNGIESVCIYRVIIFSTWYKIGKFVLFIYGVIFYSHLENLLALGGVSCSSCREPTSDRCAEVDQFTHCSSMLAASPLCRIPRGI